MSNLITHTQAGKAIITHRDLTTLTSPKWGTNGSIALGILIHADNTPSCWCLFWEWGGDWDIFGDGQELDTDQLDGWEPDAVDAAVAEAIERCPDCAEDMEWFEDWASNARDTLAERDQCAQQ